MSDYFTGPYGSYSSLKVAVAGVNAKYQATSGGGGSINGVKQGVLNLLALLKTRYTSADAKRQLAIMFSFLETSLQPVAEITSLLGEADDGFVNDVVLLDNEIYVPIDGELVISDPPALGSEYIRAKGNFITESKIVMKDGAKFKKLLSVNVISGGSGYTSAVPIVAVYCKSPSSNTKTVIGSARIKTKVRQSEERRTAGAKR